MTNFRVMNCTDEILVGIYDLLIKLTPAGNDEKADAILLELQNITNELKGLRESLQKPKPKKRAIK